MQATAKRTRRWQHVSVSSPRLFTPICYDARVPTQFISSPIGSLRITSDREKITGVESVKKKGKNTPDALTKRCAKELQEYFKEAITTFSVPMMANGTVFQKSVWKAMSKIPYGRTKTYGEIATSVGRPKAVRAVGSACGKNPLLVLVPCHRVIGASGLGGFRAGVEAKKLLLAREREGGKR